MRRIKCFGQTEREGWGRRKKENGEWKMERKMGKREQAKIRKWVRGKRKKGKTGENKIKRRWGE